MKSIVSCSVLFTLAIFLLTACGEEDSNSSANSETENELTTKPSNSGTEMDELREEQINQMRDSVEQVKTAVSPFLSEGCCAEEGKKTKPCCCEAVYASYKSMLESKNGDVVEIGMTDPILAGCRELMPSEFDKLENPPSEEPDELDDLFN